MNMNKEEIQQTQESVFFAKGRKILWFIFVLSAVVGFIYQSWSFVDIYLEYQTVVDVRVNAHDNLIFPAITVCNNNRMRRSAFCSMMTTNEPCVSNGTELFHKWAEDWHVQNLCKHGNLFWWLGHQNGELIHDCQVEPYTVREKICDWKFSRLSDPKYYMCYTINGEWETGAPKKPITSRMILEESVEISFTLDVEPREYLVYDRDLGARVVIHDPNVLPDPESEGIDLKAGTSYQIGIQQTSTVMLPPPYQTRCAHAQEIATKLNITYVKGMSRQRCLKECQRLFLLDRMGCVSKSLSFLYQERCCSAYYDSTEEDKENMTKAEREAMKHCYDICSVPCMKTSYELSVVTSALKKEFYPNYSGRNLSKTAVVEVKVVFGSLEQVTYTHRPRYEFVELFSYLGGYIGIWLGTSLISCLELLETFCKWAHTQIKRGRVKRKITRQVHVISKSRP